MISKSESATLMQMTNNPPLPTLNTTEPKYIVHSSRVHTRFSHNGLVGYRPEDAVLPVVEKLPLVAWKGAPIPVKLWREVLAFFKWSYDTTKSETQVRLFYNFTTKEWRAHAFPQERGTGLSAREINDHPNRDVDMEQFKGFRAWGTVHHHCTIGAFQSGTDKTDEESQAGLHITVGHMDKPDHDIHARVAVVLPGELNEAGDAIVKPVQKMFLEPDLVEWFSLGDIGQHIPVELHPIVLKHFLVKAAKPEEKFPDRWKENVIEVSRPVFSGHGHVFDDGDGFMMHGHSPHEIALWNRAQHHRVMRDRRGHHHLSAAGQVGGAPFQRSKQADFTDEELHKAWDHYCDHQPNPHTQYHHE
jgi:hypothetical protein